MIPPFRHAADPAGLARAGGLLLLLLAAALWGWSRTLPPAPGRGAGETAISERPFSHVSGAAAWAGVPADVLRAGQGSVAVPGGVARRYRLVGAMLTAAVPAAILERRDNARQQRVAAGDELEPGVRVTGVERDRVWVMGPAGREAILRQDGAGRAMPRRPTGASVAGSAEAAPEARLGGKRLSATRWAFSRDAVLGYYQELLDEPERLVQVFDSLEPLYSEAHEIEGYRLNVRGEADFFAAVGLAPGDVVRKVNEIPMTNRRRAEALIRRFSQNDLNVVVMEIERDGKTVKQVYETK